MQEPFARRIIPNVHYIPVRHDLCDIVEVTRRVIEEGQRNSTRLRAMAVAARDMAVESFNALAQLDSFIWGFLKAQKACTWKVGTSPMALPGLASCPHVQHQTPLASRCCPLGNLSRLLCHVVANPASSMPFGSTLCMPFTTTWLPASCHPWAVPSLFDPPCRCEPLGSMTPRANVSWLTLRQSMSTSHHLHLLGNSPLGMQVQPTLPATAL
jgi:hypothetical protein